MANNTQIKIPANAKNNQVRLNPGVTRDRSLVIEGKKIELTAAALGGSKLAKGDTVIFGLVPGKSMIDKFVVENNSGADQDYAIQAIPVEDAQSVSGNTDIPTTNTVVFNAATSNTYQVKNGEIGTFAPPQGKGYLPHQSVLVLSSNADMTAGAANTVSIQYSYVPFGRNDELE